NGTGPTLFAHGNFLAATAPIPATATVVYCPRTHAAFGHPPHRFREWIARGVRVALGTDSLASNPDLSMLDEMRFLHTDCPDVAGDVLLRLETVNGAEALGWANECGSLEASKSADFVVVPALDGDAANPHELWLEAEGSPIAVWCRGENQL